jgi:hypothetical protein
MTDFLLPARSGHAWLCLALAFLVTIGATSWAVADGLQFRGSTLTGRVDNPTNDSQWRIGDANGNGVIDDGETLGPAVVFGEDYSETKPRTSGFGSIHVNFELANPRLLEGFRDYNGQVIQGIEVPTPTIGGPGVGGNGATDDLNGDLATMGFTFVDANGNGVFDGDEAITGIFIDYPDLYTYDLGFYVSNSKTLQRWRGARISQTFEFATDPTPSEELSFKVSVGARFFGCTSTEQAVIKGAINYQARGAGSTDTQAVGPEVGIRLTQRVRRWVLDADAYVAASYGEGSSDVALTASGSSFIPGALNQPAILSPNSIPDFRRHTGWQEVRPLAEASARLSYRLTPTVSPFLSVNAGSLSGQSPAFDSARWDSVNSAVTLSPTRYAFAMLGVEWLR